MAGRMNAKWIVAFVEQPDEKTEESENALREALALARALGAKIVTLHGGDIARAIIDFATAESVSQIVIGATQRAWWKRILSRSVVGNLLKQVGEIGVYVVPMRHDVEALPDETLSSTPIPPKDDRVRMTQYVKPELILANLRNVETVAQTISVLIDHLIQNFPELATHRANILEVIMQRERLMSTFLETGIAIPHASGFEAITDIHAVMALTPQGVLSLSGDAKAYIVLLFLSPEVGRANHLKFLAATARLFIDKTTTREIAACASGHEAFDMMERIESLGRIG